MNVKGLRQLENKVKQIPNKTLKGIEKSMQLIYDESQPLVPVDTGRLKKSGRVKKIPNGYEISYHAENPINAYNYAPIQHENRHFRHRVGQAKYLEAPIRRNFKEIKRMISKEIKL